MEDLIVRVDAGQRTGTGHLMRCLALAQAWRDNGGMVTFITACESEGLRRRLREEGIDVQVLAKPYPELDDWDYTRSILDDHPRGWVVLDGYYFDEVYQQRVKEAGYRLLVIDDMAHLEHYCADIVLNQNLHAEQLHYAGEPYTRCLMGTGYVLLRREFSGWRGWKREIPDVARRVLVTLGGGDPHNYTLEVIQALRQVDVPGLQATVLIGTSNPYADELATEVKRIDIPIRLIRDARNMPELMAAADVAVATAGTAVWELAFMGVPTIAAATTPIEELLLSGLERHGLFFRLNWCRGFSTARLADDLTRLMTSQAMRRYMSELGQRLVAGHGSNNVIKHLLN